MRFTACDITAMDYAGLPRYDGAFLIGILHHVKGAAPQIMKALRQKTDRVVVLEPNGNHLVRKLLELLPSYRAAGEDSFRTQALIRMFEQAGFHVAERVRLNIFPNFTPRFLFHLLRPFERLIETTPLLQGMCTVNMFGLIADGNAMERRAA